MLLLWRDVSLGWRMLRKNPALTVVVVLSLALGIGANTTIFSVVNSLFVHPLPVRDPGRLLSLYTLDPRNPGFLGQSYLNYKDYRDRNQVFSGLALYCAINVSLTGNGDPQPAIADIASANFFDVLGVQPILGRTFQPEEDRVPGANPVAVISHGLWTRKFGADPGILGAPIHINGHRFTIIGVAPPGFYGPSLLVSADIWVPMMMYQEVFPLVRQVNSRRALLFYCFGRLRPGMSRARAEAGMKTVAAQLASAYPRENAGRTATLLPLAEAAINPNRRGAFVRASQLTAVVVGLVLLIACINIANLLLARAGGRRKEIAIRLALGAGRGRIVRQLLTESLLLALLGGLAGGLLAWWGRTYLWAIRPPVFYSERVNIAFDARVLLFTFLISILTGLLFGLVPALQTSRTSLVAELKERTSQFIGGRQTGSLRNLLVVGQVALSLVALIGAGLFVRSLQNARRIDPGFESRRMLLASYDLGSTGYNEERGRAFHHRVIERVGSLPSVQAVALASNPPLNTFFSRTIVLEGRTGPEADRGTAVQFNAVSPEFFRTFGIPIVQGRDFTAFDNQGAPRAAIVNRTMARTFWPESEDAALGKRFHLVNDTASWQIVGIARDAAYMQIGEKPAVMLYLPLEQSYSPFVTLHVRTAGEPAAATGAVRHEMRALDANLLLDPVSTMPELIGQSLWAPRTGAELLSSFGVLALALAIVGIYGVISYTVSQRVRDIGIRMALGASPRQVLQDVLRGGFYLVAAGVAAGIGCALLVTHLLNGFLFGVSTTDPLTFGAVSLILTVVALAACYLPARRATRVDPALALRHE